ncbi:hypothetical protein ACS0TY_008844 [Phlomoides rotata]
MGRKCLAIVSIIVFAALLMATSARPTLGGFVGTRGSQFVLNGRPFYFNGFNSYWLMYMASDNSTRDKVSETFAQASKYGMNVARTWAFSDGGFGGKRQYVQWARYQGQYMNNDDDFFTNSITVLTRINSISGVAYKDDSTILAWELMNEPRCQSDLSGKAIQDWVAEMAGYVKSIDINHLLDIGLEGFYGESMPEKKQNNPGYEVGTDFISNNRIPQVDFTTIHLYPDQWVPGSNDEVQDEFVQKWIQEHIDDSKKILGKPLLVTEFGKSSGYDVAKRDAYLAEIFNSVYSCARSGGPCGGALFWQVMALGMENWSDGYEVVLEQSPSTANVIDQQSRRITSLN